jgi:hypothetical protein
MRRAITGGAMVLALSLTTAWPAAAAATSDVVDGIGGGGGRIQARISGDTSSLVHGGVPWVFYGANPEYGYRLRLAKLAPTPTFVTLDGAGGANGRTTDSVATDVSATMLGDVVHVFYTDDTTQDLRHGWFDGSMWRFETLDGDSALDGRTTRDVGGRSLALVYRNRLNVFYADDTRGDVRRAVFDGSVWHYSVLDGNSTTGGRTTDTVGSAIRAGVWGSHLHVLYTMAPAGLREAVIARGRSATYATLSSLGGDSLGMLKVSDTEVLIAYDAATSCCSDGDIFAGVWNGSTWSVDRPVSSIELTRGLTIFSDGGTPYLAAGIVQCYGSGGCDKLVGVAPWNGTTFDDPYFDGAVFYAFGEPPGVPSSAVTIAGVGQLFVGGFGYPSEPDIYDQVLLRVEGPF